MYCAPGETVGLAGVGSGEALATALDTALGTALGEADAVGEADHVGMTGLSGVAALATCWSWPRVRSPRNQKKPTPQTAVSTTANAAHPHFSRTRERYPGRGRSVRTITERGRTRNRRRGSAAVGQVRQVRQLGPDRQLGGAPQDRVDIGVDDLHHAPRQPLGAETLGVWRFP